MLEARSSKLEARSSKLEARSWRTLHLCDFPRIASRRRSSRVELASQWYLKMPYLFLCARLETTMFKFIALAAVSALALAAPSSDAKVHNGPSQPVGGQFSRYRAAPRNGLLSIVPPDGAESSRASTLTPESSCTTMVLLFRPTSTESSAPSTARTCPHSLAASGPRRPRFVVLLRLTCKLSQADPSHRPGTSPTSRT